MKRLIKTVKLKFFQDDVNGEYGLCHDETQNRNESFNAFWGGQGIFHDVFEHSHEYTNKYFQGDYALNIGGEMAAMGAMWYYYEELGMYDRLNPYGYRSPGQSMRDTTYSLVQEAISYGYTNFGYTLESNVPKQRPTENSELEYQIETFWNDAKNLHFERSGTIIPEQDNQELQSSRDYKRSVTFRKIADLHRYGFRMAERLVPQCSHNRQVLSNFKEYFDKLCKDNSAEDMNRMFRGLTIKLYKEAHEISWTGIFHSMDSYEIKDVKISQDRPFYLEDAYITDY